MFLDTQNPSHNGEVATTRLRATRSRATRILAHILLVTALLLMGSEILTGDQAEAQQASFKVVVSSNNPLSEIDRDQLSKLFLKRARKSTAQPVDQSEASAVRENFSRSIHGRSVKAIKSYWLRMIFSGDASAPPELGSDQAVLSYLAANDNAIGYVDAKVPVPSNLRVVSIVD